MISTVISLLLGAIALLLYAFALGSVGTILGFLSEAVEGAPDRPIGELADTIARATPEERKLVAEVLAPAGGGPVYRWKRLRPAACDS